MYRNVNYVLEIGGIYMLWVVLHYCAAHLYIYYCAPATLPGFLLSPLLAPTPHCSLLRWAIYQGGEIINVMWIMLSIYAVRLLTPNTVVQ